MKKNMRVRHVTDGYAGITDGVTRMENLFECEDSECEIRVLVDGGGVRIAAEQNLVPLGRVKQSVTSARRTSRIVKDPVYEINNNLVPDNVLTNRTLWQGLCRQRGLNFNRVDEEAWEQLCRRRGYLLSRQNPRGF